MQNKIRRNPQGIVLGSVLLIICSFLTALSINKLNHWYFEIPFVAFFIFLGSIAAYGIGESATLAVRDNEGHRLLRDDD